MCWRLCCLHYFSKQWKGIGSWWQIVPMMNNFSVYCWVTPEGLNREVAVMFFHQSRLSGEAPHCSAECPVELSLCSSPHAQWHVQPPISPIWHRSGNDLSWPLMPWHFERFNCCASWKIHLPASGWINSSESSQQVHARQSPRLNIVSQKYSCVHLKTFKEMQRTRKFVIYTH